MHSYLLSILDKSYQFYLAWLVLMAVIVGGVLTAQAQSGCPCSLWDDTTTPSTPASSDTQEVEVGVKFRTDLDGYITAIRFYKGLGNTGSHVGNLWHSDGTLLASVVFTNETATGWQQATLPAPFAITANTTYIASYHTTTGRYAVDNNYFNVEFTNGPLHALQTVTAGGNGVYQYGPSNFPTQTFSASNYWIDVVFQTTLAPDTTPPTVVSTTPVAGATGVTSTAPLTVTFSEGMNASTMTTSTIVLRDASNALVPAGVVYNAAARTATLTPDTPLAFLANYTARVSGGPTGVTDIAGNPLLTDFSWSFTIAPPPPDEGPDGPLLLISGDTWGRYYVEILQAEGFNAFLATDLFHLSATLLSAYKVVLLDSTVLTPEQVTLLSNWVTAGGKLIAMRPDKQLAGLLGLTDTGSTLSHGYLLIQTATPPGAGLVNQTLQFHGTADLYTLSGASSLATLYSTATTATPHPAVTLRNVGSNGGQAAAFTYDLALSVIDTRQGNPAWRGQERDGLTPIRSDDMFFGAAASNPQPDWINLNKVAIPQADEQQRLLANLLLHMTQDTIPLPRFWYFPRGLKAVVIMTGDDHANGGTAGRFNQYLSLSPAGCDVNQWQCVRSTSYIYHNSPLTDAQAASYTAQGFEVALHLTTGCANWTTPNSLDAFYTDQLGLFAARYPSIPPPTTHRIHCLVWSDYVTQAQTELAHGIRLDTNYYYWPASWVLNRPGFFTGSGLPMRFVDLSGNRIDVYQATTQLTDESGQSYPATINTLLDNALGTLGYYGAFTANLHTDSVTSTASDAVVASAQARGVPIVSARQMLQWLDGRNSSSFDNLAWTPPTLNFTIIAGANTTGMEAMLPTRMASGTLTTLKRNGVSVSYVSKTLKGVQYATFPGTAGTYQATYLDTTPPTVSSVVPTAGATQVAITSTVNATFSENMNAATITTSTFTLRNAASTLIPAAVTYNSSTRTATLTPSAALAYNTTYTATLQGGSSGVKDLAGNPLATSFVWSFTTTPIAGKSLLATGVAAITVPTITLSGNFTIESWAYMTPNFVISNNDGIVSDGTGTQDINFSSARMRLRSDGIDRIVANTSTSTGVWRHYAIVRQNNVLTLYINGQPNVTVNTNWTGNFVVRRLAGSIAGVLTGQMDELRVWNVARSSTDIATNYNRGVAANSAGLVAYYKFNDSNATLVDAAGNDHNGTLASGTSLPTSTVPLVSP